MGERLMIVLYDAMLLDDLFCARQSQDKRRHLLERLVHRIPGQAEVGSRQVIRFSSADTAESLRKAFSLQCNAIAQRWEGLVLKGLSAHTGCPPKLVRSNVLINES
ncbi:hypothetical protein BDV29DRAFT_179150 [Aspergillus leporis]|uniref:ATP-dependent DNA ligase family profile domain-containing protein n=1 Tax=Aspergillus leporis TaxID=41062 RepID=A0A5N5WWI1_9EURO|nr:hypothetical protein BDV29DRAFT_179150 [Aspergillus leporis]